jgi:hypothetical protein
MKPLPINAKAFVAFMALGGLAVFSKALLGWNGPHDLPKFLAYLLVAMAATRLKVSLPGMTSSMCVNLPFIMVALIELSLPEGLIIAAASTFVQSFWPESKKRNLVLVGFNVSVLVLAAQASWLVLRHGFHNPALLIVTGTLSILVANTMPVAMIIAMTEAGKTLRTWFHILQLTFPYYSLVAGIPALVKLANYAVGWRVPLFILPAMFLVYRSYVAYFRRLVQPAQNHPRAMAHTAAG